MLTLFRRHESTCVDKRPQYDRTWKKCKCPIHTEGMLGERYLRRSLKTRNWNLASRMIIDMEAGNEEARVFVAVGRAIDSFKKELQSRGLAPRTLRNHNVVLRQLAEFAEGEKLSSLSQFTPDHLNRLKQAWGNSPLTTSRKLILLKEAFGFFEDMEWIKKSPARKVKAPKVKDSPTQPFTDDEVRRIEESITAYAKDGKRLAVLLDLLLHTGLRISDAVGLRREQVEDGCVDVDTRKTGANVRIPLPPELLTRLQSLLRPDGTFFYSGDPEFGATNYRAVLRRATQKAGIDNVHPHRYRDTLAVRLLNRGVSLEDVSKVLGHKSIRVTEKHYAPWVKSRQVRLEENIRKTWIQS